MIILRYYPGNKPPTFFEHPLECGNSFSDLPVGQRSHGLDGRPEVSPTMAIFQSPPLEQLTGKHLSGKHCWYCNLMGSRGFRSGYALDFSQRAFCWAEMMKFHFKHLFPTFANLGVDVAGVDVNKSHIFSRRKNLTLMSGGKWNKFR